MNLRYFFLLPFLLFFLFYIGKLITGTPLIVIAVACALAIGLITFQNPKNGLIVLVFSMLLSPQLILLDIPGRPLTVRIDDLLIIVVFIAWLGHIGITKDWKGFVKTDLDFPIVLLLILYVLGTSRGILFGTVANPLKALFFTLKYVEYYILYWLAANLIDSKEVIKKCLIAGVITLVAVTIYAYSQFGDPGGVAAPFDWGGREPASLGGYYLIIYAVIFAFLLHAESIKQRMLSFALILFLLPPFVKTLSRASYLAFFPMILTMLLLTRKGKTMLGGMLLLGVLIFPIVFHGLYSDMTRRVMITFTGTHDENFQSYRVGSAKISDQSALERIKSWRWVVSERFARNPLNMLIGSGVTGLGFIEGQFFLVLGETGILGAVIFYWILFRIFRISYRIYRSSSETIPQSVSLAAAASVVGLLFQSLTTNTFIIVRIMEPFWFLVALAMIMPDIFAGSGISADGTLQPAPAIVAAPHGP